MARRKREAAVGILPFPQQPHQPREGGRVDAVVGQRTASGQRTHREEVGLVEVRSLPAGRMGCEPLAGKGKPFGGRRVALQHEHPGASRRHAPHRQTSRIDRKSAAAVPLARRVLTVRHEPAAAVETALRDRLVAKLCPVQVEQEPRREQAVVGPRAIVRTPAAAGRGVGLLVLQLQRHLERGSGLAVDREVAGGIGVGARQFEERGRGQSVVLVGLLAPTEKRLRAVGQDPVGGPPQRLTEYGIVRPVSRREAGQDKERRHPLLPRVTESAIRPLDRREIGKPPRRHLQADLSVASGGRLRGMADTGRASCKHQQRKSRRHESCASHRAFSKIVDIYVWLRSR